MSIRAEIHKQNLVKIFNPKSIAVVGTNNVKGTVPYDILFNILKTEFTGVVFPVSPGEKSICSVKAYKYVLDITDPIDLAIIVFPSAGLPHGTGTMRTERNKRCGYYFSRF